MKIKSIYIDGLHNAVSKTYNFDNVTYLYGRNGVGKSTVLNAIQLALLGYIPGTGKSKDAILSHSPTGNITIELTLTDGSDEVKLKRQVCSGGNILTTYPENFDFTSLIDRISLPIFDFNEFIGQTANKLKDYFISNILDSETVHLDWYKLLEEPISELNISDKTSLLKEAVTMLDGLDGTPTDVVCAANDIFKQEVSFIKGTLSRIQNTIDSLIYYDDYSGPTDLLSIEAELLSLSSIRDEIIRYNTAMQLQESNVNKLSNAKLHLTELNSKYDISETNSRISEISSKVAEIENHKSELMRERSDKTIELRSLDTILNSDGRCPYSNEYCDSARKQLDLANSNKDAISMTLDSLSTELTEIELSLKSYMIELNQLEVHRNDILRTTQIISELESSLESMGVQIKSEFTTYTIPEIDIKISELTDCKVKLLANNNYNETIDKLTSEKYELELRLDAFKSLVTFTSVNGLQTKIMVEPFEHLTERLTQQLQCLYDNPGIQAKFNLSTKANSFNFGIVRNGNYIPYDMLSSGEKCIYTVGLMICISTSDISPLKLVLCDDIFDHLDDIAANTLFDKISNISDVQFILAGVKYCENCKSVCIELSKI